jgi:type I restriction enzyme, R subunit
VIKIVMTGSASDPLGLAAAHPQQGRGARNWPSASRTPNDPFKIVIVRDMWLTGFDAPCLHTMYVDKPMRGHGLMQAIARVNRCSRTSRAAWWWTTWAWPTS